MSKIVRVSFALDNTDYKFFIDRSYNESVSDQINCDNTLKFLADVMDQKKTIAAMQDVGKDSTLPVLINLDQVTVLSITAVAVYSRKEKEEEDKPLEVTVE